uniref:Uncharacterized protein n=1 Tax=Brassica campestris TaxID=3711 RepID=M4DSP9_BRACM
MEFWDVFMKVTLYNFYSTSVWPLLLTVSIMLFFRHEYRFINLFALRFKCTEIKHGKPINNVKQEDGYMFYVAQSHTSYNQKANKHVVTHSFEIYRIHFLELFHAAFAVRIEDTPDEVINFSKTGRLFTFESQKKLWMKQQILWTAIKINEKRTVEREAPSREMWRRERTAVDRAARIVAA